MKIDACQVLRQDDCQRANGKPTISQAALALTALVLGACSGGGDSEINGDDLAPGVGITVQDAVAVDENANTPLTFGIRLSRPATGPIAIQYQTVPGTATADVDFESSAGTVSIPAGLTGIDINVPVHDDGTDEADEFLSLELLSASAGELLAATADGTILDDDPPVLVSLTSGMVTEGNDDAQVLSFTLRLAAVSGLDVSVDYVTVDGTATSGSDYEAISGTITLPAGTSSATIDVVINGDSLVEDDETFTLTLSNASNAELGDTTATGTIRNDDFDTVSGGLDSRPDNTSCVAPDQPTGNASVSNEIAFPNLPALVKPVALLRMPADASQWFVVEQDGRIVRFASASDASSLSTFIDIRSGSPIDVESGPQEAGLLGMAFDPGYGSGGNWNVYLSYIIDGPDATHPLTSVIARFRSNDNGQTLDPASAETLVTLDQPYNNHNGGQIEFGPDGYLYVSFGDGGNAGDPGDRAQNTANLFGAMLRLDVSGGSPYRIPASNPFFGNGLCADGDGGAPCPEIYAWGLRNPWRWSFDNPTGLLWLADVGQGSREEVNLVENGGNYGWRCREGTRNYNTSGNCPDGLIDPVIEYDHVEGNSITGGYVYRGDEIPELDGRYVFADYTRGKLFAAVDNGDGTFGYELLQDTNQFISSFAMEPDGELLYLDYGSGLVRRIVRSGGNATDLVANQLSDTGCVNPASPSEPAAGLVPYDINVPFWSDDATKERWYAIPNGTEIEVAADGDWLFPVGSVLMKHFRLNGDLVETRLFMRHTNGEWAGYTYEWVGSDAVRVNGGKTVSIAGQDWVYPSGSQCMVCHTSAANFSLGPEHGQLNRDFTYPDTGRTANQLVTADEVDLLADDLPDVPANLPRLPDPTDTSENLASRARAYLHANCSGCHRPGGPTPSNMDLRYGTTLEDTNTCDIAPNSGDLGLANARIVSPGNEDSSVLTARALRRDAHGMPPLASNIPDVAGVQLLRNWIDSLAACP